MWVTVSSVLDSTGRVFQTPREDIGAVGTILTAWPICCGEGSVYM